MKLGLGFLFGARDAGLKKVFGGARKGLGGLLRDADLATESGGRLHRALSGLNLIRLGNIEDQLQSLGSTMGDVVSDISNPRGGLSSSIETMAVQFDKDFAWMAARAGLFGS